MVKEAYLGTLRIGAWSIVIQSIGIILLDTRRYGGSGMLLHKCADKVPTNGISTLE